MRVAMQRANKNISGSHAAARPDPPDPGLPVEEDRHRGLSPKAAPSGAAPEAAKAPCICCAFRSGRLTATPLWLAGKDHGSERLNSAALKTMRGQ